MQKITRFFIFSLFFFCIKAWSAEGKVIVTWDPNTEEALAGYRIYYGTQSGVHSEVVDVGNLTKKVIPGFQDGVTYYFVVVAYDSEGREGPYSDEVFLTIKVKTDENGDVIPQAPQTLRILEGS